MPLGAGIELAPVGQSREVVGQGLPATVEQGEVLAEGERGSDHHHQQGGEGEPAGDEVERLHEVVGDEGDGEHGEPRRRHEHSSALETKRRVERQATRDGEPEGSGERSREAGIEGAHVHPSACAVMPLKPEALLPYIRSARVDPVMRVRRADRFAALRSVSGSRAVAG